ncbi:MAG: hypothetical protein E7774_07380, partial [Bradyrhizobium sp.]
MVFPLASARRRAEAIFRPVSDADALAAGRTGTSLVARLADAFPFIARARGARRKTAADCAESYAALAAAIGDVVLRHDRSGAVIAVSGDATEAFGHCPDNLFGRGFFNLVHVADRPAYLNGLDRAAHSDQTIPVTLRLR